MASGWDFRYSVTQVLAAMTSGVGSGLDGVAESDSDGGGICEGNRGYDAGSLIAAARKSWVSSSTESDRRDRGSVALSSTKSNASSDDTTVWPFTRPIGRFDSACAGRGGVGSRVLLFASRM